MLIVISLICVFQVQTLLRDVEAALMNAEAGPRYIDFWEKPTKQDNIDTPLVRNSTLATLRQIQIDESISWGNCVVTSVRPE